MGAEPRGKISQAMQAWERIGTCGELDWLENPTFISIDCFRPPSRLIVQPRGWNRIAVPAAIERRSDQKIYKRVNAKPRVDRKYRLVVAELESQGLGERKRARTGQHVVPYGSAEFEVETRTRVTGGQELAKARDQVKGELQKIWRDNLRLRNGGIKRSTVASTQLTWVPRKRHNTRWPINPPGEDAAFIAEFQPLIKFELHPSQIDEAACFEHENNINEVNFEQIGAEPNGVPQLSRLPEPEEPAKQLKREKPGHRRRTLRPSLSTISEATGEATVFPVLISTPNRLVHASPPAKNWQAATDGSKISAKIAESPMKNFTLDATPNIGNVKTTAQSGHLMDPPSPTNTTSPPDGTLVLDHAGHFLAGSTLDTDSTITNHGSVLNNEAHPHVSSAKYLDSIHTAAESSRAYVAVLPFFDQPIPDVQNEPEHESRRRVSLDIARRSDRTFNSSITKRVHKWMAGASVTKRRRHSDVSALYDQKVPKRRHTLDVDAGMNPDIFGQLNILPSPTKAPHKSGEALDGPVKALQEDTRILPAVPVEEAPVQLETAASLDEDLASSEQLDNVEGDSDMAYLQSFVQRSKSSKEEKRDDTPSAPILLNSYSKKRRSGSMNSATSDAGSPMAKTVTTAISSTTASLRVPLGEKDANKSPSPSKKRKLKGAGDGSAPIGKKQGRLVAPDLDDIEPTTTKRKKRRKGMESDTDDIFNPDMNFDQVLTQRSTTGGAGARRSTRIATHKVEPAPINVRVPGGVFVDNGDMPAVSTAGITNAVLQRKVDQDLATKTKANTRKNRGSAVPVQMALASMAERLADGGLDDETITTTTTDVGESKRGHPGGVKSVRWDETLARVQGEESVAAVTATAVEAEDVKTELDSQSEPDQEEREDEIQLPSPPQLRILDISAPSPDRPGNPVADQLATDNDKQDEAYVMKSVPTRRSSRAAMASRLPKRGAGVAPAAALLTPATKRSSLPAPSRVSKPGGRGGAVAAIAAAETRARLGMAGPETPAPRRGGRRGGRRG